MKTENGSDLTIYVAPPSFRFPRKNHLVGNFYFRCSGLNCKDLCKIRQNGEFSVFSFCGIEKSRFSLQK
jgi:hypothetical protein